MTEVTQHAHMYQKLGDRCGTNPSLSMAVVFQNQETESFYCFQSPYQWYFGEGCPRKLVPYPKQEQSAHNPLSSQLP